MKMEMEMEMEMGHRGGDGISIENLLTFASLTCFLVLGLFPAFFRALPRDPVFCFFFPIFAS